MRNVFIRKLAEIARDDKRVLLLTADLGYMALEPFAEAHPQQFFNVGVAEQNMMGMATGLAEGGFIPFTYSIVTFATLRGYEFIRNGPVYHQLPVRIVGIGGGMEYAMDGISHHGFEDVGVMRLLPGMTVIAPADSQQARTALEETWSLPGPIYYRLGKDEKTLIPGLDGRFSMDRIEFVREGKDALLLAMGPVATEAVKAADELRAIGLHCAVGIMATIQPVPMEELRRTLSQYRVVLTVEAHYANGALGSLVAEAIADHGLPVKLTRCGVRAMQADGCGNQTYLLAKHGLSAHALTQCVRSMFQR